MFICKISGKNINLLNFLLVQLLCSSCIVSNVLVGHLWAASLSIWRHTTGLLATDCECGRRSVDVTSPCNTTPSALLVRITRAVSNVDVDSPKEVCALRVCALRVCARSVCVLSLYSLTPKQGLFFQFY